MKVLVAVDSSGSVRLEQAKREVQNFISKLCPDIKLDFAVFDHNDCVQVNLSDYLNSNSPFLYGGSSTTMVRAFAEIGDYDHTYIITDGYMDKDELEESDTVSVVIYEDA